MTQSHPTGIVHLVATIALAGLPVNASACTICFGFPEKTDADYLLDADCVVLARESKKDPFSYEPQETLKGHYDGVEIDLLVDSKTRRTLQASPDQWVILVQDGPRGPWRSLGIVSEAFVSVARRILLSLPEPRGQPIAQQRWEFFVPLFGHGDPRIKQLAYLELGRAPYDVIKRLGRVSSREDWMPMLTDRQYLEWRSLAILLLAQSENSHDKQRIVDVFRASHRFGLTTNLAAWAAAAIEVESELTIKFIEDEYFRDTESSPAELEAVTKALSMHGSQPEAGQQDEIVATYRVLLAHHPQFAPQVADDLHAWNRSDLIDELTAINQSEVVSASGKRSIQRYLRAVASLKELAVARE